MVILFIPLHHPVPKHLNFWPELKGIESNLNSLPPPPIIPPSPNSPPQDKKKKSLRPWSMYSYDCSFSSLVLVIIVFLCYYRMLQRKESKAEVRAENRMDTSNSNRAKDPERGVEMEFFDKQLPAFDLDDLLRASTEVLGKGALGTSYKTTFESGPTLAVKRLKDMNKLSKEFFQQM